MKDKVNEMKSFADTNIQTNNINDNQTENKNQEETVNNENTQNYTQSQINDVERLKN